MSFIVRHFEITLGFENITKTTHRHVNKDHGYTRQNYKALLQLQHQQKWEHASFRNTLFGHTLVQVTRNFKGMPCRRYHREGCLGDTEDLGGYNAEMCETEATTWKEIIPEPQSCSITLHKRKGYTLLWEACVTTFTDAICVKARREYLVLKAFHRNIHHGNMKEPSHHPYR